LTWVRRIQRWHCRLIKANSVLINALESGKIVSMVERPINEISKDVKSVLDLESLTINLEGADRRIVEFFSGLEKTIFGDPLLTTKPFEIQDDGKDKYFVDILVEATKLLLERVADLNKQVGGVGKEQQLAKIESRPPKLSTKDIAGFSDVEPKEALSALEQVLSYAYGILAEYISIGLLGEEQVKDLGIGEDAINLIKKKAIEKQKELVENSAEFKLLDGLVKTPKAPTSLAEAKKNKTDLDSAIKAAYKVISTFSDFNETQRTYLEETYFNGAKKLLEEIEKQELNWLFKEEVEEIEKIISSLPPDKHSLEEIKTAIGATDLADLNAKLVNKQTDLKKQEGKLFGVTGSLIEFNETAIGNLISDLKSRIEVTKTFLDNWIKESSLTIEDRKDLIEDAWAEIVRNEKGSKSEVNAENVRTIKEGIKKIIEAYKLDGREDRAKEFENEWSLKIKILDGFSRAANTDIFKQLSWQDVEHSRTEAGKEVGLLSLREFVDLEHVKPVIKEIGNILLGGQIKFVDKKGDPLISSKTEKAIPKTKINDSGEKVPSEHDFGKFGNPSDSDLEKGVAITLNDFLKQLFKDEIEAGTLDNSSIDAAEMVAIIGELRCKAYAPYYDSYATSPKSTIDVSPIQSVAPMAYILYKIRSIELVPPGYRALFQIFRLPSDYKNNGEKPVLLSSKTGETERQPLERDMVDPLTGKIIYDTSGKVKKEKVNSTAKIGIIKNGKNVKIAIELREAIDKLISYANTREAKKLIDKPKKSANEEGALKEGLKKVGYFSVELPEDLTIMPYIWDLIVDRETGDYAKTTYKEYADALKAWEKLRELVENPPKISKEQDVQTAIGMIISTLSPMKGIIAPLEGSKYYPSLIQTLQQMFLRYTKYIYDEYESAIKIPNQLLRNKRFGQLTRAAFDQAGTLVKEVREFMVPAIDIMSGFKGWDDDVVQVSRLFSDVRGVQMINGFPVPSNIKTRFDPNLSRYFREPSIEEQKQGE